MADADQGALRPVVGVTSPVKKQQPAGEGVGPQALAGTALCFLSHTGCSVQPTVTIGGNETVPGLLCGNAFTFFFFFPLSSIPRCF